MRPGSNGTKSIRSNFKPDWWKLEAQSAAAWASIADVIARRDAFCRGVVMLGLDAPAADLTAAFRLAAASPVVKGFAVGRTIFAQPAADWLGGRITDAAAIAAMAGNFAGLVRAWEQARAAQH